MSIFVKCEKGTRYDYRFTNEYEFSHWEKTDGSVPEDDEILGYNFWNYFDEASVYLGPDKFEIEPVFWPKV